MAQEPPAATGAPTSRRRRPSRRPRSRADPRSRSGDRLDGSLRRRYASQPSEPPMTVPRNFDAQVPDRVAGVSFREVRPGPWSRSRLQNTQGKRRRDPEAARLGTLSSTPSWRSAAALTPVGSHTTWPRTPSPAEAARVELSVDVEPLLDQLDLTDWRRLLAQPLFDLSARCSSLARGPRRDVSRP